QKRIRDSEGALSGLPLARWGLLLSLAFGGYYTAYLFGTPVALRTQAPNTADCFLRRVRHGPIYAPLLQTLSPKVRRREDSPGLRRLLEVEHNTIRMREPGAYANFTMSPYVRAISQSGADKTKFERSAITTTFEQGAYKAVVTYIVKCDTATF